MVDGAEFWISCWDAGTGSAEVVQILADQLTISQTYGQITYDIPKLFLVFLVTDNWGPCFYYGQLTYFYYSN